MRARYFVAALAASSPLFLGGCGIPPAITIASYVADGFSYAASGKSLEDHALSAVADQDCALHRVLQEKAICSDYGPPQITMNIPSDAEAAPGVPTAGPASSQAERRGRD